MKRYVNLIAAVSLIVAGAVSGQFLLVTQGVTILGQPMAVTPAPMTIVPAEGETIKQVLNNIRDQSVEKEQQ